MRRTRQIVTLATIGGVVLLVLASAVLAGSAKRQLESWRWVVHTREVLEALESVAVQAAKAESEQRAFLVTGLEGHLDAYRTHAASLRGMVETVQVLTADNAVQQARIPDLRTSVAQRMDLLAATIEASRHLAGAESPDLRSGVLSMRRLDDLLEVMRIEENSLLHVREQQVAADNKRMIGAVLGLVALSIGLMLALRGTARRDLVRIEAAHEALLQANLTLEDKVQERTQRLEEANALLEGFARTVAHDLRTPLRTIEGLADALAEDERGLSPQGADYLRRISRGAGRMDHLVTDLLLFSRSSKAQLVLAPTSLDDCVRDGLDAVAAAVARTGASVDVQPGLPQVMANAPALVQVLCNLFDNALKFVAPGTLPHVQVRARRLDGWVLLDVQDNGIGIPADARERVFGVFERLHAQERYEGTGIGLAIVRDSVQHMGGGVELDSEPGRGSVFTLRLRAAHGG
jgi:signal transduction histidine kinase